MTVRCPACGNSWAIDSRRRQRHSNLTHKAIAHIASALGQDPAALKVELKLRTDAWAPWPMKTLPEWPGQFVSDMDVMTITGYPAVFLKTESAYTIAEESELLKVAEAYAYDNDIDMSWMEDA